MALKSTILKAVAGLLPPTKGKVLLDGRPVGEPGRDRGMVFQTYTSFGWLTVQENVEYGLKLQGVAPKQRGERARVDLRQKINAILGPEQQKKYAEMVAAETGRGSVGGSGRVYLVRDDKPVEVRVRTGLTDGNATEVSGGELAEGNEVIVGTVAIAAASRPSASGPRLPF